jgi:hypothetical protein
MTMLEAGLAARLVPQHGHQQQRDHATLTNERGRDARDTREEATREEL